MFCPSEVLLASVPIPSSYAGVEKRARRCNTRAKPKVAHWIVDDAGAGIREASDIVTIKPDAVRSAEARAEYAQPLQMRH